MEFADWPGLNHMTLPGAKVWDVSWTPSESHKLKVGMGGFQAKSKSYYQRKETLFPDRQKVIDVLYNLLQYKC